MLEIALALALRAVTRGDTVTMNACAVAPVEQLRFVVAAGLGHGFPVTHRIDGAQIAIDDPTVTGASCSPLKVDLRVSLRLASAAPATDSIMGSARVIGEMSASVVYRPRAKGTAPAEALAGARLCFHDASVTVLDLPHPSPHVEPAQVRAWVEEALRDRECADITALVYVFLQRGGKPAGS